MFRFWNTFDTIALAVLLILLGTLIATGAEAEQMTCMPIGDTTTVCTTSSGITITCTRIGIITTCN